MGVVDKEGSRRARGAAGRRGGSRQGGRQAAVEAAGERGGRQLWRGAGKVGSRLPWGNRRGGQQAGGEGAGKVRGCRQVASMPTCRWGGGVTLAVRAPRRKL